VSRAVEILSTARCSKDPASKLAVLFECEGKTYLAVTHRQSLVGGNSFENEQLLWDAMPIEVAHSLLRMGSVLNG